MQNVAVQLNTLAEIFAQVDYLPKAKKTKINTAGPGLGLDSVSCLVQQSPYVYTNGGCPSAYLFCLFVDSKTGALIPGLLGDFQRHQMLNGMLRIVVNSENQSIYSYRFSNLLLSSQGKAANASPDFDRFLALASTYPFLSSLIARYVDKGRIWSIHAGLTPEQHTELANLSKQIREKLFTVSKGAIDKRDQYQKAIQLADAVHNAHKTAGKTTTLNTKPLENQVLAYLIGNWSLMAAELANPKELIVSASTLPMAKVDEIITYINNYINIRKAIDTNNQPQALKDELVTMQITWETRILQHKLTV